MIYADKRITIHNIICTCIRGIACSVVLFADSASVYSKKLPGHVPAGLKELSGLFDMEQRNKVL